MHCPRTRRWYRYHGHCGCQIWHRKASGSPNSSSNSQDNPGTNTLNPCACSRRPNRETRLSTLSHSSSSFASGELGKLFGVHEHGLTSFQFTQSQHTLPLSADDPRTKPPHHVVLYHRVCGAEYDCCLICMYPPCTLWSMANPDPKTNIFLCTPISDFWTLDRIVSNKMRCIDIVTMDIFTNSWSAFEDLIIWALPIPILYKLKVPTARKAGLYLLHFDSLCHHPRECFRDLDQICRHLMEFPHLPTPLRHRAERCTGHLVTSGYLPTFQATRARASTPRGTAAGGQRAGRNLEQPRKHPSFGPSGRSTVTVDFPILAWKCSCSKEGARREYQIGTRGRATEPQY